MASIGVCLTIVMVGFVIPATMAVVTYIIRN